MPTPKNEIQPVRTGIEVVDRELRRREPFATTEEADATAAALLRAWRGLTQPGSDDGMLRWRQRRK